MKAPSFPNPVQFLLIGLIASVAQAAEPKREIQTRDVSYPAGSVEAKGFLAFPAGEGKHPGVLVVHEWWGLNDYARTRARMLAEAGYAALAIDMYGDGKSTTHPKDAREFASSVMSNLPEATERFEAAMTFLQDQPMVDREQIAAIGYCFGGGLVLRMAAQGLPGLDGVASFHGSLDATVPEGVQPSAAMLVLHGSDDSFVPDGAADDFEKRMKEAGVSAVVVSYPGAKHGFSNPEADAIASEHDLDIAYDASADRQSWQQLLEFLSAAFPRAATGN